MKRKGAASATGRERGHSRPAIALLKGKAYGGRRFCETGLRGSTLQRGFGEIHWGGFPTLLGLSTPRPGGR
jgi:hypothetical protein